MRLHSTLALLALALALALGAASASASSKHHDGVLHDSRPHHGRLTEEEPVHHYKFTCEHPFLKNDTHVKRFNLWLKQEALDVARVFVSSKGQPSIHHHEWMMRGEKPELTLHSSDSQWPESDVFYMAVVGRPSRYALTASCHTEKVHTLAAIGSPQTQLQFGVQVQGTVSRASPAFYSVQTSSVCDIAFLVTTYSGDADLFVSRTLQSPGPGGYDYRSIQYGLADDYVNISHANISTYYLGVYSYTATSSYGVLATQNCTSALTPIQLLDGVPQSGGGASLYRFSMIGSEGANGLSIDLSPIYGDPDFYVTADGSTPSTSHYQWHSSAFGADNLLISPTDPAFCHVCNYTILVYPFTPSQYVITVSTLPDEIQLLQDGIPVEGRATANTTVYYKTMFSEDGIADITIQVTALLGDPDVFVSTSVQRPNLTTATWYSRAIGSDALTIDHEFDPNCTDCYYFIAIQCWGRQDCNFNLLVTWAEPYNLEDGMTVSGILAKGATDYFEIVADEAEVSNVTIQLTPISGMCDLYVSLTGIQPNRTYYNYTARWWESQQVVSIPVTEDLVCGTDGQVTGFCVMEIGVTGIINCTYSISASLGARDTHWELEEGVPLYSELTSGTWEYYSFENNDEDPLASVTFRLSALFGDPDLYVTSPPDAQPFPSPSSNSNFSRNYGDDEVVFYPARQGVFYIAVYGFTNTSFTITAEVQSASHPSIIDLEDGVPETADIGAGRYAYFAFWVDYLHEEISLDLQQVYGQSSIYITNDGSLPSFTNFQYSGILHVTIPSSSPEGRYIVAVYGVEQSEINLLYRIGSSYTDLQDGMAIEDHIDHAGDYAYYRYHKIGGGVLRVELTPLNNGDTDLYVSVDNPIPTTSNSTWQSNGFTNEVIIIGASDSHNCEDCDFYIGAYAFSANCTYSIVATAQDIVELSNHIPHNDVVSTGQWTYYTYEVLNTPRDIKISVHSSSGSNELFVAYQHFPTLTNWKYHQTGSVASVAIHQVPNAGACTTGVCIYYIGVYGNPGGAYAIVASN